MKVDREDKSVSFRAYVFSLVLVLAVLVPSFQYIYANNSSVTIAPGSSVETASYVIFKEGSTVYAKNGQTGEIEFSSFDAATVIQAAIDVLGIPGGTVFMKNGTYDLGSTGLTIYARRKLEGESWSKTILKYSGSDVAVKGTNLDFFQLENLKVEIGNLAKGCLLIGAGTTFASVRNVQFLGTNKTVAGQYGIRFDAGGSWTYYNWVVDCFFQRLNIGIVTESSSTEKANGQLISNPVFYDIGAVGIDFSPDKSNEHTVIGGFWAHSAGATGFRSNSIRNLFIGCQLEMGTNAKSFELGNDSSSNVVIINDNNANSSINNGTNNYINGQRGVARQGNVDSGTATVANNEHIVHGLARTPTTIVVTPRCVLYGGFTFTVGVVARNSTHFRVGVYWTNGTAIIDDVIQIDWSAVYEP